MIVCRKTSLLIQIQIIQYFQLEGSDPVAY